MDCSEIIKLVPIFLDGELSADEHQRVQSHLDSCAECRKEAGAMQSAWEMMAELEDIQPDPAFKTRFWAKIDEQSSWQKKFSSDIKALFFNRRLVPALAAAGLILGVSFVATYKYLQTSQPGGYIAEFGDADLDMLDNIDLAENFDLIRNIDLISDLEIIEDLNDMNAS